MGSLTLIPLVSQGWERFPIKWIDASGQRTIIRLDIGNLLDIGALNSAGIKCFLVRQYFHEESAASPAVVVYPEFKTLLHLSLESSLQYSVEVSKVAWRRSLISEPGYILRAYAGRVDL